MIEKSLDLVEGIHQFDVGHFGSTQSLIELLNETNDYVAGIITCSELQAEHTMPQVMRGQFLPIENLGGTVASVGGGNLEVDSGMLSTIAYSIDHYGLQHLIVCGHIKCQIVRFVVNKHRVDDPETANSYFELAEPARGIIDQFYGDLTRERTRPIIMQEHVLLQIEHLLSSPPLRAMVDDRDLKLHGWLIDDEKGHVYAYNALEHCFAPIG